jgi:hypothetical protein
MGKFWMAAAAATTVTLLGWASALVAAQDEVPPAAATGFTAHYPWGPILDDGTVEERPDGTTETLGFAAWTSARESSDPRFDGRMVYGCNEVAYPADGGVLLDCVFRIETDDGAWQNRPAVELEFPGTTGFGPYSILTWVFDGEGAYEGLTAIVEITEVAWQGYGMHGLIVDGDLPPTSTPYIDERD